MPYVPPRQRPDSPLKQAKTLAEFPADMVRLACDRCGRAGQYRKATLEARYGADMPLPSLRHLVAQCPRNGALGTSCGVFYPDLVPKP